MSVVAHFSPVDLPTAAEAAWTIAFAIVVGVVAGLVYYRRCLRKH